MKSFEVLSSIAIGNYGLITAQQARDVGITSLELRRWVKCGRLDKVGRAVYRLSLFPSSPNDEFAVAVEMVGEGAYLQGESVLALLRLTATNPTWIHVATAKRCRKKIPNSLRFHVGERGYEPIFYEGICCQRVSDAILSCKGGLVRERLLEALRNGVQQGYVSAEESVRLEKELQA